MEAVSTDPQTPSPHFNPLPDKPPPLMTSSSSSSSLSPQTNEPLEEDDSGYISDSSPDVLTEDSTDSCSSKAVEDEEDDDSDMMEKIYFLREKQRILERATSVLSRRPEASYSAAIASDLCHGSAATSSISNSSMEDEQSGRQVRSIWSEAKQFLSIISRRTDTGESRLLPVPASIYRKRCAPNPGSPMINPRIVQMVSSKRYESGCDMSGYSCSTDTSPEMGTMKTLSVLTASSSNQWMTKALLWNNSRAPSSNRSDHVVDRWTVTVGDQFTCSRQLVPPPSMSLRNAFDLQDVISVTEEARIVTQSSPPFCIVHVNRAFLEYAEFPKYGTLVGRPVEMVFQVNGYHLASSPSLGYMPTADEEGEDEESRKYISATILGEKRKACHLRVMPVVDRSRRRRITFTNDTDGAIHCMSHVLILVEAATPSTALALSSPLPSSSFLPIQRYSSPPTSKTSHQTAAGATMGSSLSNRHGSTSSFSSPSSSSSSALLSQTNKADTSGPQIITGMVG